MISRHNDSTRCTDMRIQQRTADFKQVASFLHLGTCHPSSHTSCMLDFKCLVCLFLFVPKLLNETPCAMRLHSTRSIHCVPSQIAEEFLAYNDACHYWSGINSDAKCQLPAPKLALIDTVAYIQCQPGENLGVVRAWARYSCSNHVAIADSLALL